MLKLAVGDVPPNDILLSASQPVGVRESMNQIVTKLVREREVRKEFDGVLLVPMDESLNATAIYEADREPVVSALSAPDRNRETSVALSEHLFSSLFLT